MNCSACGVQMITISEITVDVRYVNHVIEYDIKELMQCPKCKTIIVR